MLLIYLRFVQAHNAPKSNAYTTATLFITTLLYVGGIRPDHLEDARLMQCDTDIVNTVEKLLATQERVRMMRKYTLLAAILAHVVIIGTLCMPLLHTTLLSWVH